MGRLGAVAACAVLALGPAAQAADRADVEARSAASFVEALYERMDVDPRHDFVRDDAIFERSTARLIDRGLPGDSVGLLDHNPFWSGQDRDAGHVEVTATTSKLSMAKVKVRLAPDDPASETREVRIDLVRVAGAWRIFDMHEAHMSSLRAVMQAQIRAEAGHKPSPAELDRLLGR